MSNLRGDKMTPTFKRRKCYCFLSPFGCCHWFRWWFCCRSMTVYWFYSPRTTQYSSDWYCTSSIHFPLLSPVFLCNSSTIPSISCISYSISWARQWTMTVLFWAIQLFCGFFLFSSPYPPFFFFLIVIVSISYFV